MGMFGRRILSATVRAGRLSKAPVHFTSKTGNFIRFQSTKPIEKIEETKAEKRGRGRPKKVIEEAVQEIQIEEVAEVVQEAKIEEANVDEIEVAQIEDEISEVPVFEPKVTEVEESDIKIEPEVAKIEEKLIEESVAEELVTEELRAKLLSFKAETEELEELAKELEELAEESFVQEPVIEEIISGEILSEISEPVSEDAIIEEPETLEPVVEKPAGYQIFLQEYLAAGKTEADAELFWPYLSEASLEMYVELAK